MNEVREAPRNRFFESLARFVVQHRVWLGPLLLLVTVAMAYAISTRLTVDSTTEGLLHKGAPAKKALDRLHATFGEDKILLVQIEGDVFTLPFLEKLRALHRALEALDVELDLQEVAQRQAPSAAAGGASPDDALAGEFDSFGDDEGWGEERGGSTFEEVTSLINVRRTEGSALGLDVHGLLDDWPSREQLPAIERDVLADPTLVGQVVDDSGEHAAIVLRTGLIGEANAARVFDAVVPILERHEGEGFHIRVVGAPVLETILARAVEKEAVLVFGLCTLVLGLCLVLMFRHPLGVLGPLLAVMQAVAWTLGLMALTGTAVTPITNVLTSFVLCVGVGDTVHIQSVYRDMRRRGVQNEAAIIDAVATTGLPVLFTTLTTMVGLLSFRAATLGSIQDMGTFGALGVGFALLQSLVFLPIVLSFNTRSLLGARTLTPELRHDRLDSFLEAANRLSKKPLMLPASALVTVLAIVGISQLRYYHDPLSWFPERYGLYDDVMDVDEHLGGSSQLSLLVSAKEGETLKNRELWLKLEALRDEIVGFRQEGTGEALVGNALSALDVLKESWRAVHQGDPEQYRVPPTQRGVVDMFTLFESAGPEELKRLLTLDAEHAHMMFRVKWQDAAAYGPLTERVRESIDKHVGDAARVEPTGAIYTSFSVVDSLITDLVRSFGTALVVITLMMILLLRNLKLGLIAMVPNLLPIAATLGFMGAVGMPLDAGNVMVASIAIGIAVDDTIHFLHQFHAHYLTHGKVEPALRYAFSHTGRAIVTTSILLAGGFSMFLFGELTNVERFGALVAVSVVFALAADLLVAPAVLRRAYRDRT